MFKYLLRCFFAQFILLICFSGSAAAMSRYAVDDAIVVIKDNLPCLYIPTGHVRAIQAEKINGATRKIIWMANNPDESHQIGGRLQSCIKYGDALNLTHEVKAEPFLYDTPYQVFLYDWNLEGVNNEDKHAVLFCVMKTSAGILLTKTKGSSKRNVIQECTSTPWAPDKPSLFHRLFGL